MYIKWEAFLFGGGTRGWGKSLYDDAPFYVLSSKEDIQQLTKQKKVEMKSKIFFFWIDKLWQTVERLKLRGNYRT